MKGLLLKDFYVFFRRCRFVLLSMALFPLFSIMQGGLLYFPLYSCMMAASIPITFIAYDERDGFGEYAKCLPYSSKDIVMEKYLTGLILSAAVIAITALLQLIKGMATGSFLLGDYGFMLFVLTALSLTAPAIMLPLVFRFGVEKGRIAYYILLGMVCVLFINLFSDGKEVASVKLSPVIGAAVLLVLAAGYLLSIGLSIRFYEKQKA